MRSKKEIHDDLQSAKSVQGLEVKSQAVTIELLLDIRTIYLQYMKTQDKPFFNSLLQENPKLEDPTPLVVAQGAGGTRP